MKVEFNGNEKPTFHTTHPDLEKNRKHFLAEMEKLRGGDPDKDAVYPNGVRLFLGSSVPGREDLGWFKFQMYANPVRLNTAQPTYVAEFGATKRSYDRISYQTLGGCK